MFEHDMGYNDLGLGQAINRMHCKPFSTDFKKQIATCTEILDVRNITSIDTHELIFPNKLGKKYVEYSLKSLGIEVIK